MSDTPFAVYVDDVDLRSLDFWPQVPAGLRGSAGRDALAPLLGRSSVVIGSESVLDPRSLTLEGTLICGSNSEARARWAALQDLFAGTIELRCEPYPDQVLRARRQRMSDQPSGNLQRGWKASIELQAADPLWYDRVPSLYCCPEGALVPLAPGTAPSGVVLLLYGPAENPVIDLLTPGGGSAGQQAVLTGTLTTGAAWEIDPIEQEIVTVTAAGDRSSTPGVLTYGDYIVLDPLMGTGDAAGYPLLRVTGCDALALVRRAWL